MALKDLCVVFDNDHKVYDLTKKNVAFLDFETTGLHPEIDDEIIQVAVGYYKYNETQKIYEWIFKSWFTKPTHFDYDTCINRFKIKLTIDKIMLCLKWLNDKNKEIYRNKHINLNVTNYNEAIFNEYNNHLVFVLNLLKQSNLIKYEEICKKISEKDEFMQHQLELINQAYTIGEDYVKTQQTLSILLEKRIIVTYNGINFDQNFIWNKTHLSNIDVYGICAKLFKSIYSYEPVLLKLYDENNQEIILPNLKQTTVGEALNVINHDAHNAAGDITQLSLIFNIVFKLLLQLLINKHYLDANATTIPLELLYQFNNLDYYQFLSDELIYQIKK